MSNVAVVPDKHLQAIENAFIKSDISALSSAERISYYKEVCASVGLNPLTRPFSFLKLQGREIMYAGKDCSEQLRKIHGVSTQILSKGIVGDMYEVHIKAKDKTGREDEDIAYVVIKGLSGSDLANAMLKCVTKAKRRVTLSICGLGILDESELDTLQEKIQPTDNPQRKNPFKDEDPLLVEPDVLGEIDAATNQDFGAFVIRVGKKYLGKRLDEVDQFELNSFVEWVKKSNAEKGREVSGEWKEFVDHAEAYLASREVQKEDAY